MKYWLAIVILSLLGLYTYNLYQSEGTAPDTPTALELTGAQCLEITNRASAHIVPTIEFQRLELEGRRANVMRRCMQDHGYSENPVWVTYAQPLAAATASSQSISTDEAIENMRRHAMYIFASSKKANGQAPLFWLPSAPKSNN